MLRLVSKWKKAVKSQLVFVQDAAAQDHSVASMLRNASTLGDSVLLIAALCFHSVFEGIAIGVAGKIIIFFLT